MELAVSLASREARGGGRLLAWIFFFFFWLRVVDVCRVRVLLVLLHRKIRKL